MSNAANAFETLPAPKTQLGNALVLANNIHLLNTLQLFGFSCDILGPDAAVKAYDVQIKVTKRFLPGQDIEYRIAFSTEKLVLKLFRISPTNDEKLRCMLRVNRVGHGEIIARIVRDTAEILFNLASAETKKAIDKDEDFEDEDEDFEDEDEDAPESGTFELGEQPIEGFEHVTLSPKPAHATLHGLQRCHCPPVVLEVDVIRLEQALVAGLQLTVLVHRICDHAEQVRTGQSAERLEEARQPKVLLFLFDVRDLGGPTFCQGDRQV